MFLPSKPRGTSTNQHEQAWTMKLVSISHVFSITCIACCNVLWHNLIFYKLNQIKWFFRDYVLTKWLYNEMSLQNDSPPGKSNILMKTTFHVKNTFRRLSNKHSSSANCRNKWCQNAYKWSVSGKSPNCQAACLSRFWGASLLLRDPP